MARRTLPHIVVPSPPIGQPFTLRGKAGRGKPNAFMHDRREHGQRLLAELKTAFEGDGRGSESGGSYVSFESFPGLGLALESLDSQSRGQRAELVAVRKDPGAAGDIQTATVFVPEGKKGGFVKKLNSYLASIDSDALKNAPLVEGIHSIKRATLFELWTDPAVRFPSEGGKSHWWEVWLRRSDGQELSRLLTYAQRSGISTGENYLGFGDRSVVLLKASVSQLSDALEVLDDIAELREPRDLVSFLPTLDARDQQDWVADLVDRLVPANADAPAVCVLDTGVQENHPLLAMSLDPEDVHVADAAWHPRPVHGHGTEVAGLSLFGDLAGAVLSPFTLELRHRLESVKFLPDSSGNAPELYGAVTARAVDRPEIERSGRRRVFMLAVTAPQQEPNSQTGRPSSWSSAIDALAFGRAIDDSDQKLTALDRDEERVPRLFVVSAGNIRDLNPSDNHLDRSDLEAVEEPAQAWNALTVGAYTERDSMAESIPDFSDHVPLAEHGQLSPCSRTSVSFDPVWPFKPEVVAEGGNVALSPDGGTIDTPENLSLLTTRMQRLGEGAFTTTRDTSAATAQVSALAADIHSEYPSFRPETVRALIVHSAEWTPVMKASLDAASGKGRRVKLLRRYGMGVPNADRALRSAADALVLVAESEIRPFEVPPTGGASRVREMNVHDLPWPHEELLALENTSVRLRVTLSYFVEPNPSSRGWNGRYAYPSHGLRFAMKRPDESGDGFLRRINSRSADPSVPNLSLSTEDGWYLGVTQQQSAGSIHTDIWEGPAISLASKGTIAVYPVAGWWKSRPSFDQSSDGVQYSLVVSIESPAVEVDLWTPVSQQIAAEIVI